MFSRRFLLVAILATAGVCTAPSVSQADFKVKVDLYDSTGTTQLATTTVTDGDNDGNISLSNTNLFSGITGGGLDVSLIAHSNRTNPNGNPAQLQDIVASIQNGSSTAYQIRVTVTDTDYLIPVGLNPMTLKSKVGNSDLGTNPVSGTFQSGVDVNNQEFAFGFTTATQNVATPSTVFGQFNRTGVYSISNQFILNLSGGMTGAASLTGTSSVTAAPAPAGLILLLGAVPFVGLFRRVMKRTSPATEAVAT